MLGQNGQVENKNIEILTIPTQGEDTWLVYIVPDNSCFVRLLLVNMDGWTWNMEHWIHVFIVSNTQNSNVNFWLDNSDKLSFKQNIQSVMRPTEQGPFSLTEHGSI